MSARFFLRLRAPFGAFRPMQAGVYRATAPVPTFSALWGLALNLAGIESRGAAQKEAPPLRLALGVVAPARVNVLYQQLHGYPVGASGQEFKARTFGSKYWIAPGRREVLGGIDVVVGVEGAPPGFRARLTDGVEGRLDVPTYGLPFLGDNNFMLDRVDVLDAAPAVRWYTRLDPRAAVRPDSCRLTVAIDRENQSRTTSDLVAPIPAPQADVPADAWVWTPCAPGAEEIVARL